MKLATIGTGFIVDHFLSSAQQVEGIELYAVYSRKEETGRGLADKYNIGKVYTDLEEMLADTDIDCVYVASPNSLHYEHSLKALRAQKHVICEKPFTSTVKQFEELVQSAKENKVFLMEAIITQHLPNLAFIKEHMQELGTLRMIQCNFSQYSSRYPAFLQGEQPNVFNPAFSGGALADINIYNLHFCVSLFGKPKTVHYYPNIAHNGIDTSGTAILLYDGFQAVCIGCKDTRSKNIAQIQGESGYMVVDGPTSIMTNGVTLYCGKEELHENINEYTYAMTYEIQDFVKMLQENDTAKCDAYLEESRAVMEVYEALRKDGKIIFPSDAQ